jgi:hypothetical protein
MIANRLGSVRLACPRLESCMLLSKGNTKSCHVGLSLGGSASGAKKSGFEIVNTDATAVVDVIREYPARGC